MADATKLKQELAKIAQDCWHDLERIRVELPQVSGYSVLLISIDKAARAALREREGMVMVPRDAWEWALRVRAAHTGEAMPKITPERALQITRAMLAAASDKDAGGQVEQNAGEQVEPLDEEANGLLRNCSC